MRRPYTLLTVLFILTIFAFLGLSLFNTRGEPREAVVAMSMLNDGNWILPVNNGTEIAFKPPFLHWLVALFSTLLGGITELTSRLPSALACWAMTLTTYAFFRRRAGERTALLTALITFTNFEVHRAALTCRVDMLLAACTVMAMYAFCRWTEGACDKEHRPMKGIPFLAITLTAGAALTKGPVGAILPCAATFIYLWLHGHKLKHLIGRFVLIGLASLVPLFIWYALAYAQPQGGERFLQLVYEENVLRFTGKMTYASHENPWWYNVQTMLTGLLPYTLLLLFAIPAGWRNVRKKTSGWTFGGAPSTWHRIKAFLGRANFSVVCFWTVFIFYCIPASKRSVYLLPCYPFAAYYLARLIERFTATGSKRRHLVRWYICVIALLGLILSAATLLLQTSAGATNWFAFMLSQGKHGAENVAFLQQLATPSLLALSALAPAAVFFAWLWKKFPANGWWIVAPTVAIFFILEAYVLPAVNRAKSDRPVAEHIEKLVPKDAQIFSWRMDQVPGNRMHPFTVNFYLNDRIVPLDTYTGPISPEAYVLLGNDEAAPFLAQYPNLTATLVYDSHHRSCDDKKELKLYKLGRK